MNTVIGLFTQAVKKFGSRVAVVDDKLAISYNELDVWSNQIAADISKQNLLPESPVIVLLPRSAKYIASILGILKSGCCYMPIDSNYPEHRIKYIADKAKVNLFICDNSSCGKIGKETALTPIAQLLLERLLGCKRANLDKTFVESGVDSLMVTEMMLELEKFTGRKITLEGFWHLTIREYLRKIETDKNNTQNEAMILLADNGKKAPLYLIHTLPGDILSYIDLVRTLTGRPIYGIQSPYLKKTIPQNISLEKIAEQYVDLIIANNHGEKIYLCGWCFGGILAVEMAEQLKVRGYDVAFLGLIETWFHTKKLTAKLSRIYDLIRCGPSIACRLLKKRFLKDSTSMENLEKADFLEKRFSLSASGKIAQLKKLYALNLKAGRNYTMKYYAGHLELFRSSVPPEGIIPSESLRWQGYCDSYNMNECPGEHQQILQYPNVEILGNKINNILAELESEDVVTYHKLNSTKL